MPALSWPTRRNNVNSRMSAPTSSESFRLAFQIAAFACACLLGAAGVRAQASPAAGSASAVKVGVINVRQAIASTSEGKQAGAELQSQFAPRQNELEGLNKQISDLRQRIEAGQGKLNQDEATRLQREGEIKERQLQRKQDEYQ